MSKVTVKLIIDPQNNSLTFSKNFRIFSTLEPLTGITEFTDFVEDLNTSSPEAVDLSYLTRYFRYSRNRLDWSLWYEVSPENLGDAGAIFLDKIDPFYFEVKYEYDNGTKDELPAIIQINEVKLRFLKGASLPDTFSPQLACSDERCNSIISTQDPSFRPYEVNSAIGMYQELSYFTNQLYGHQVVYFRTLPDSNSGDYIFKEWTLYENVDRKCIKVLVPKNTFPSNAPKYTEFGMDFQLPFEIHLDHKYFQSVFGSGSEPRKRDFLYFPLINRMFEIQGSYLHRGFMMTPTFWKISLKKFNPNIDMLLQDSTRTFLDNVIVSSEQLFEQEIKKDIADGTMPQQYKTISTTFDSSRKSIHPDIVFKPLKYTFNFASLIENYYDMTTISQSELVYEITNDSPAVASSINRENLPSLNPKLTQSNQVILAYQESGPYAAWKNGSFLTSDKNFAGGSSLYCRIRGPFDTIPNHEGQSESGRYLRIEGYRDLSFSDQRDILVETTGGRDFLKLKTQQTAVIYQAKPKFNLEEMKNLSFTCLFNIPSNGNIVNFIEGFDNESQTGLRISGQFTRYFGSQPEGDLTINVYLNSQTRTYTIANFKSGEWHGLVISISNEFKQCGVYVYSIIEDPSDIINHTDFNRIFSSISSITQSQFDLEQQYSLSTSNLWIANLRLFNTMLKEEQHDFVLSQQFVKDESLLIMIDNCRPQLNLPYIVKNR